MNPRGLFRTEAIDLSRALAVLLEAYPLVASGWVQNFNRLFPVGTPIPESGRVWPLWRAIATGTLDAEHARRVIRQVIGDHDIPGWESHPLRTKDEVLHVLRRAIGFCGGTPPPLPRRHRGGWAITTGASV